MNGASVYPSHSYYRTDVIPTHSNSASTWPHLPSKSIPTVFDYYHPSHTEYYGYNTDPTQYNAASSNSTGTPSPHSLENGSTWNTHSHSTMYSQFNGYGTYQSQTRKRGMANSKKERRRTISINGAFSNLRDCIPNVPKDTKLSKIKTLRLACSYIQHLMDVLSSDNNQPVLEFKADLTRKTPCRAEKRKCIEAEIAAAAERKSRGRSGWPQTIWTQDLKHEENFSKSSSVPSPSGNMATSASHPLNSFPMENGWENTSSLDSCNSENSEKDYRDDAPLSSSQDDSET